MSAQSQRSSYQPSTRIPNMKEYLQPILLRLCLAAAGLGTVLSGRPELASRSTSAEALANAVALWDARAPSLDTYAGSLLLLPCVSWILCVFGYKLFILVAVTCAAAADVACAAALSFVAARLGFSHRQVDAVAQAYLWSPLTIATCLAGSALASWNVATIMGALAAAVAGRTALSGALLALAAHVGGTKHSLLLAPGLILLAAQQVATNNAASCTAEHFLGGSRNGDNESDETENEAAGTITASVNDGKHSSDAGAMVTDRELCRKESTRHRIVLAARFSGGLLGSATALNFIASCLVWHHQYKGSNSISYGNEPPASAALGMLSLLLGFGLRIAHCTLVEVLRDILQGAAFVDGMSATAHQQSLATVLDAPSSNRMLTCGSLLDGSLKEPWSHIQPNIGLQWYLFAQVFPQFRYFFRYCFGAVVVGLCCAVTLRLRRRPLTALAIQALLLCMLCRHPTYADVALCLALLSLLPRELGKVPSKPWFATALVVALSLCSVAHWLWLHANMANVNFLYGMNLALAGVLGTFAVQLTKAAVAVTDQASGLNPNTRA